MTWASKRRRFQKEIGSDPTPKQLRGLRKLKKAEKVEKAQKDKKGR